MKMTGTPGTQASMDRLQALIEREDNAFILEQILHRADSMPKLFITRESEKLGYVPTLDHPVLMFQFFGDSVPIALLDSRDNTYHPIHISGFVLGVHNPASMESVGRDAYRDFYMRLRTYTDQALLEAGFSEDDGFCIDCDPTYF